MRPARCRGSSRLGAWTGGDPKFAITLRKALSERLGDGLLYAEGCGLLSGEDAVTLNKVMRQSPTMGAKAPEGALVLFHGLSRVLISLGLEPEAMPTTVVATPGTH